MKNRIITTIALLLISQNSYSNGSFSYICEVDYTQDIISEQANYIRNLSYKTEHNFNELGITVATNDHHEYPERFFILSEPLVRSYKIETDGSRIKFKSNEKILVDVDLKKIPTDIKVKSNIQSYTDSYLLVDFIFYNPSTMSRGYTWQVNFGDTEINREYVARSLGFEGTYNYFDCKNEIEETTFKEYQKYWVNLVEIINNNEVNYTNR